MIRYFYKAPVRYNASVVNPPLGCGGGGGEVYFLIGLIVSHGVKICRGGLQSPSLIAPDKMETILL